MPNGAVAFESFLGEMLMVLEQPRIVDVMVSLSPDTEA
jgi:hypothetical protein